MRINKESPPPPGSPGRGCDNHDAGLYLNRPKTCDLDSPWTLRASSLTGFRHAGTRHTKPQVVVPVGGRVVVAVGRAAVPVVVVPGAAPENPESTRHGRRPLGEEFSTKNHAYDALPVGVVGVCQPRSLGSVKHIRTQSSLLDQPRHRPQSTRGTTHRGP